MNIASIIGAIAGFSWLLVIAVVIVMVLRASRGQGTRGAASVILVTVLVALVLNVVSAGLVFVPAQERAVVVTIGRGGVRPQPLEPGLNWIIPFAETVVEYPISRQTYTMSAVSGEGALVGDDSVQARTADGQIVYVDASVIFSIDPTKVVDVHVKWQSTYIDGLVRPQSRGIVRDMVSGYQIEDVYSAKREELKRKITDNLAAKLSTDGLILVDFVLRNISFSPEYAASVEQKQIADQLAQQAAFVVEQKKQEAEQARQVAQGRADAVVIEADGQARALRIRAQAEADARLIQAEAEAQALEMLAAAIRDNPDVLTLEYIQKLAPNIRIMLLPSTNPLLLSIPGVNDLETAPTTTPEPVIIPTSVPTPEPTPTP